MKEFMLLILNQPGSKEKLSKEKHTEFLKKCEQYIERLKQDEILISAQPLINEGKVISVVADDLKVTSFEPNREIQVGYYHIFAKNIDEATAIAKMNPEFEYSPTARIEIRPIKVKEETGYIYP